MQNDDSKPIPRVEISDYAAMGRKVLEWAKSESARPTTIEELKTQLAEFATVPDRLKHIEFVQSTLDKLVIRLPPIEMAEEGRERAARLDSDGSYNEPRFYKDRIVAGDIGNLEYFFSRVGDYTIAQCR